jgi:hypothetical protein
VLLQKCRPQLQHLLGTLFEHAQDRLAVVERHDPCLAVVGAFEPFGGVEELGFRAGWLPIGGRLRRLPGSLRAT